MHINFIRNKVIDYPSGSAMEYYNNNLYLIGDDVNYILCLDKNWNEVNKIKLFEYDAERIPKPDKPDLESATIIGEMLYVVGSGSKSPQRDVAYIINLSEHKIKKISTAAFYSIFRDRNLLENEMNIEGFTDCRDKLLFFNRANTKQSNQVIITDQKILKKQWPDRFKVIPLKIGSTKNITFGISGACYDEKNDILILSASAENTDNAYDDGEIIGSAIAIVKNATKQIQNNEILVDELMELETIDPAFEKQKIESVCITQHGESRYTCLLVADNDDGKSVLFEVEIIV